MKVVRRWFIGSTLLLAGVYLIHSSVATFTTAVFNANTGSDDASVGTVTWSSPGNITLSDNSYATATLIPGQVSHFLKATNFKISPPIPSGSTILGITVNIEKSAPGTSVGFVDNSVKIVKNGVPSGTDQKKVPIWSTTDAVSVYGSASNLWGLIWTADEINNSGFGVAISALSNEIVSTGANAQVDQMQIFVTYQYGTVIYKATLE